MENRGSKAMALAALIVGVVGLTIGFAAFSSTLTINSGATYTPDKSQFEDEFGFDVDPVALTKDAEQNPLGVAGTVAEKYAKAWTGISASFTDVNQTQEFEATIVNDSAYKAIPAAATTIALVVDTCETRSVEGMDAATTSLKNKACGEIQGTVTFPTAVEKDGGTAQAHVTIQGPTTAVDGVLDVTFRAVELQYTTAVTE